MCVFNFKKVFLFYKKKEKKLSTINLTLLLD